MLWYDTSYRSISNIVLACEGETLCRDVPPRPIILEWVAGEFDPELFDLAAINEALRLVGSGDVRAERQSLEGRWENNHSR